MLGGNMLVVAMLPSAAFGNAIMSWQPSTPLAHRRFSKILHVCLLIMPDLLPAAAIIDFQREMVSAEAAHLPRMTARNFCHFRKRDALQQKWAVMPEYRPSVAHAKNDTSSLTAPGRHRAGTGGLVGRVS